MLNIGQSNDLTIDETLKPSSPSADTSNEECLQTVLQIEPKDRSKQSRAQYLENRDSMVKDSVSPPMSSHAVDPKDSPEKRKHNRCFEIDREFLPVKIAYFVYDIRKFCFMPYFILISTSFGLTKTQAGLIAGIRLTGSIVGNLFWGMITDRSRRHSIIVVIQVICSMLLMIPQPFVAFYLNPGHVGCRKFTLKQ